MIACDAQQFSKTDYARSRLYVALRQCEQSLTLVVSQPNQARCLESPPTRINLCEKQELHAAVRRITAYNRLTSAMNHTEHAERYIGAIRDLGRVFDRLAAAFRSESEIESEFNRFSSDDWRRNAYGNAMIRLRILVENNFQFVETLGLLCVARYVFELSIWLRLFKHDKQYCLVYYKELLETQLRNARDTLAQLHREAHLLEKFEAFDNNSARDAARAASTLSVVDLGQMTRRSMDRVDAEASRQFSLYLDEGRTNGFGFQAHLVRTKAVPQAEANVRELEKELQEFERNVPSEIRALAKGRWQWRSMSEKAGVLDEHDYIYAYASKLLHATPASLTTDQKNLEMTEVCVFLRYIHVKMLELADLAYDQPECKLKVV